MAGEESSIADVNTEDGSRKCGYIYYIISYIINNKYKYYQYVTCVYVELPAHRAEDGDSSTDNRSLPRAKIHCLPRAGTGLERIAQDDGFATLRAG